MRTRPHVTGRNVAVGHGGITPCRCTHGRAAVTCRVGSGRARSRPGVRAMRSHCLGLEPL
jgi:hypothetical protein